MNSKEPADNVGSPVSGYALLGVCPFIGLAPTFLDLPVWAEALCVLAILVVVFVASARIRRTRGTAWLPSKTVDSGPTADPGAGRHGR